MARRLLCCTDNLSVLPVCGVFLSLLGIVLFILFLVAEGLTTSLQYINAALPVWVPAVLLLVTGIAVILLSKKRPVGLLVITLCLSIASAVICVSITVPTIINIIPLMESLTLCVYQQSTAECRCYVVDSKHNGTNLISIPEGSQQYTFKEVKGCDSIEHTLKDIVFTECVIYCFGAFACCVATVLTSMLLCNERKSNKSPVQHINSDAFDNPNSHRFHYNNGSRLFLNGPGQTYIVGLNGQDQDRRALINSEVVPTEERTSTVTNTTNTTTAARGSLPLPPGYGQSRNAQQRTTHVRRSSSSSSAAVPRPVPSNSRHHSISTADAAGLGTRNARSSRPPPLVRGGFMQSRPDGRAVPVYTIPGSNQAYISLNDLPSLQMPNMDSVPAYVPRATSLNTMQGPYPNEQPPPYSPTAEYTNGEVPPFTATALTTVNEASESALSSPVRNTADVNAPVPVDNPSIQSTPEVMANDENMEMPAIDNPDRLFQETINESLLNENFTFGNSGSNQSPRSLQDLASVTHSSDGDYDLNDLTEPRHSEVRTHNVTVEGSETMEAPVEGQTSPSHMWNLATSSKDNDYDLHNLTESRQPETNNMRVEDLDKIEVSLEGLTPASQRKWNQGTSSRESLAASLSSLAPELISGTSRRLSDDHKTTELLSGIGEGSVESISNKRLPMGARPKVKPKPGKQRSKKKISEIKATSTSRLDGESFLSSMNNNSDMIDNIGVDGTNFRSKTTSMPDLSRPSSVADDNECFERTYGDSTNKTEMFKTSSSDPKLWAFEVGTIDGRRKKNTHRNTTAFYDLIERANDYQRKEAEKSSQGNKRKQEHKKRSKNTQNSEYNISHTNPRQKAKIRTDLPASSAWGSKKNIPSISGRAGKHKNRPQLIKTQNADKYKMGLSSSSNESLTGVINLVANTATSSTRARKKRVLQEAQSITELLDTRV
ncbi:mucin-5AC-like [Anneissia japonica]|uniref:mucin-5AC-like n=1 Tax=Anneissia japonica TaxID=1529436 RepID=UPI00142553DF|nr:mucin-5AC-like [Anneissia japonica]